MVAVENVLSTSFCAVAAFMRVEPVTTSGPVSSRIATSTRDARRACGLALTSTVAAPRSRATSNAPPT
ncbi:hypothetical protein D3C74_424350 [compost metagenome]